MFQIICIFKFSDLKFNNSETFLPGINFNILDIINSAVQLIIVSELQIISIKVNNMQENLSSTIDKTIVIKFKGSFLFPHNYKTLYLKEYLNQIYSRKFICSFHNLSIKYFKV